MFVKGVNLGNWLVLEKWMSPALFAGTEAADEYYLAHALSQEVYEARIRTHRASYISEGDFVRIRSFGLNAVRIPVPYFIFGDRAPFIGCIEELDKAFNWAERYGLRILIDLHTAPFSQNGFDNGGISGVCLWSQKSDEVAFVLSVLERLAARYGKRPGLWGIELINEPVLEDMWEGMKVQERYPPVDAELGRQSKPNTLEFLKGFYLDAHERLTRHLHSDAHIVIHDAFNLTVWKDFMRGSEYKNVVLDTHQYLMMAELRGCEHSVEAYERHIAAHWARDIEEMQKYFPVICGEWCIFNSLAVGSDTRGGLSPLNGLDSTTGMDDGERAAIYRAVSRAQLAAWQKGSGWFYWSYKLLIDTVNDRGWKGWDSWDLGRCIDSGWFPAGEDN